MSGLEAAIGAWLERKRIAFQYEALIVPFIPPVKEKRYKPDFILPNGIIVEAKGRFDSGERQKFLAIKASHPSLDIRFVFSNPRARISKKSQTTYGKWCDSKGFPYAKGEIPLAWISEPPNRESLACLEEIRKHRLNRNKP